jgi:hypothetical protein
VVAMAVRHDNEIERGEIYAFGFNIMREDVGVVSGVK